VNPAVDPDRALEGALAPGHLARSITEGVGHTPLLELRRLAAGLPGRVAVKLESRNPSGSVKDRVAVALVDEAEQKGVLRPGGTLVAPTSGNTGIALAHIGAARAYKVRIALPEAWSHERIALLLYLGADVMLTPGSGMRAAVDKARDVVASTPGSVLIDQFGSPANPEMHRRTTAEEIWRDSGGQVAFFVAGVGTGGTVTGVGLGLRAHKPGVRVIAVEPASSAVLSGESAGTHAIQGIGAGFVPPLLRFDVIDEVVTVTDEQAFDCTRRLALEEGILAGVSSGAALFAALAIASRDSSKGKLVVTMVCDSGERYVTAPRIEARPTRGARR
jgi:cysteine synthase A